MGYPRSEGWLAAAVVAASLLSGRGLAAAEELTVSASLSQKEARVGEIVTLDVRAVATTNGDITIELPPLEGLSVLGRSENTQMQMSWSSSGQTVRREKVLRVELAVDSSGRLTVPPVTARLGGTTAESAPLSLDVSGEDPAATPVTPNDGEVLAPGPGERQLFIRYRLSRGEAWLGEQVLLDLEIFADPGLGFQVDSIPDPPDLDGFWREVLERPKRLVPRVERVNGERYQVFRAWRFALFPLQAGERTLDPVAVSFRLGGGGFFGGGRRARRRARALKLEVKPLPEEGRPPGFDSANVGTYALTARVEDPEVKTGKALVLKVSLSGEGNVKSARLPKLESLEGFRVFPPTVEEQVDLRPTGVQGTKTAEILLVPQRPGTFTIPRLELPTFDPREGAYEVLETEPIEVRVTGEPVAESDAPAPAPTDERPAAASTRPPLRYRAELDTPPHLPWRSGAWWLTLAAGPLLWVGVSLSRRAGDSVRARREDPRRGKAEEARRRLDALEVEIRSGDAARAAAAFMEAFHARADLRLGRPLRSPTSDEVASTLREAGADEAYARELAAALEGASYARYAPGALGEPLESLGARWIELVKGLDALGDGGAR